ncbi:MAG: 6,7-dimethyl-8-ribityllumazine synthase [Acidimicrobiales bacterium]|jgi:6,7-dimethyl-8-ribityllumazine synthase|nr:6,7-dimethyl-8-ribityllumazine synthase [Acidimicrobiales bacterium]MEC9112788.1 6,7-dimethyl-8-ribityllumazine synthase [Actinomycetota bacterium]|tara:strand:+ start:819 stop:1298 length:480 start_codon:yes stop_codon:yes gene_type:complete
MASGENRASASEGLDGDGLRIAIVHARWNTSIVDRLLEGALRGLDAFGAKAVGPIAVPGCFELPMACQAVASSGDVDAVVAIGAVVRGETTHYEIVSEGCASGIQQAQLQTGIPITFGVLTVESTEQATERSQGPGSHNVGEEAAVAAIEMARLVNDCR